jgi:hypothetical protein
MVLETKPMDIRGFTQLLAITVAIVIAPQVAAKAQTGQPQVRMRWQAFIDGQEGAKRLASLQKAVQKMKSLDGSNVPEDFRRSWRYWANIHGYYGPSSRDGTLADQIDYLRRNGLEQYVPFYEGITDQTPPDSIAQTVWATCEHGTENFFGWHRMYVYYFERVLRWAAQDDTLRLPYWDYTDPAQVALPADFRNTANTFFDAKRKPAINNGTSTLDPRRTNVNSLLNEPDYFKYQDGIDNGVHGHVHCTVGPTCPVAHMGDVPVAGNDPVFYTHHANIDRLWACWQQLHPTPAGPWQDAMFSFVDETGKMQTQPVKNFLNSAALGYVYDNVAACARPAPGPVVALAAGSSGERKTAMIHASKGIAIASPTTNVDLDVPRPRLEGALRNLQTPGSVELVLRDITADSPPATSFDVFLAARNDPGKRQLVGTISWFGAFSRSHRAKDGTTHPRTLTFDVTNELRALGGAATTAGLVVTIEATDGLLATDPARQEAQQAEARKAFRAAANVRIGSIELHAVPDPGTRQ